jgi:hypothetical protein
MMRCPGCGKRAQDETVICPRCGKTLPLPSTRSTAVPVPAGGTWLTRRRRTQDAPPPNRRQARPFARLASSADTQYPLPPSQLDPAAAPRRRGLLKPYHYAALGLVPVLIGIEIAFQAHDWVRLASVAAVGLVGWVARARSAAKKARGYQEPENADNRPGGWQS